MSQTSQSTRKPKKRSTLGVAGFGLAILLLAQFAAIGWAIVKKRRQLTVMPPAVDSPAAHVGLPKPSTPSPVVVQPLQRADTLLAPAAAQIVEAATPATVTPDSATAPNTLSEMPATSNSSALPAPLDVPLSSSGQYFYESALTSREKGDIKAALQQLRAALDLHPDHPRILFEMASIYEKIGETATAQKFWDKLFKLGPDAGSYFKLAELNFVQQPEEIEAKSVSSVMKLGRVLIRKDNNTNAREQHTIRIPVQTKDFAAIDPVRVYLEVLFYDRVNQLKIEPTSAEVSAGRWLSGSPQWLGSAVEFLEMTYRLPPWPEVNGESDHREFYGYVVKLYYDNQLQDILADPPHLAKKADTLGDPPLDHAAQSTTESYVPEQDLPFDTTLLPALQ